MPVMTKIGAMKIVDPRAWNKAITRAMATADGRVGDAATALGVSERQLFRWLALDELKSTPRAEYGMPRDGKRGKRAKPKLEEKTIPSRKRRAS